MLPGGNVLLRCSGHGSCQGEGEKKQVPEVAAAGYAVCGDRLEVEGWGAGRGRWGSAEAEGS